MESLTLVVALGAVGVVLLARPVYGLIAYLAVLLLYPDYLRVSLGTVDVSACRIVVTVLLIRCVAEPAIMRKFRWKLIDKCVIASMVVYGAALAMTTEFDVWLENRLGFVMDTMLVYFAVRLIVTDRPAYVMVMKWVGVFVIFLAVHGVMETFTGFSIYKGLGVYCPWAPTKGMEYQTRYGLNRSMGPSGETIMFGLTFAALIPLLWNLRHEPTPLRRWGYIFAAAGMVGVASTVSSGPYMALIVTLMCLALERMKQLVKPMLIATVLGCIFIEIASNRHVYYVIGDFTMDPESAWYRARLIDVAIMKLPEYWQFGYGFGDPGWGPYIDGRNRSDGVNDYIVQAVLYGIGGLLAYLAVLAAGMIGLIARYRSSTSPWVQSSIWALGSAMVGLYTAFWSVSLFGQAISVLYVMLGLQGAFAVENLKLASAVAPASMHDEPTLLSGGTTRMAVHAERA